MCLPWQIWVASGCVRYSPRDCLGTGAGPWEGGWYEDERAEGDTSETSAAGEPMPASLLEALETGNGEFRSQYLFVL